MKIQKSDLLQRLPIIFSCQKSFQKRRTLHVLFKDLFPFKDLIPTNSKVFSENMQHNSFDRIAISFGLNEMNGTQIRGKIDVVLIIIAVQISIERSSAFQCCREKSSNVFRSWIGMHSILSRNRGTLSYSLRKDNTTVFFFQISQITFDCISSI